MVEIINRIGLKLLKIIKRGWEKGIDDPEEIFSVQDILIIEK